MCFGKGRYELDGLAAEPAVSTTIHKHCGFSTATTLKFHPIEDVQQAAPTESKEES